MNSVGTVVFEMRRVQIGHFSSLQLHFSGKVATFDPTFGYFRSSLHTEQCGDRESSKKPETRHPACLSPISGLPVVTSQSSPFLAKKAKSSNFWKVFTVSCPHQIISIEPPSETLWKKQGLAT